MSFKRNIISTFLTQAPTLVLYFFASTMITRLLGDTGRGEYALLTNQVALFAMMMSLNLGFGITFFTSRAAGPERDLVGAAATMLLLDILLVPLILFAIAHSDRLTGVMMPAGRTHWGYWAFVFGSIMFSQVNTFVSAILLGLKQFKVINWMGILNASLSAVGFLILYLLRGRVASPYMLPSVLVVAISTITLQTAMWVLLYIRQVGIPPIPVWAWSILRPLLAFSLIGHFTNLINLVNYRFDVWVVSEYKGTAALGLYTVAVGMAQLLFYIPDPFSRVVQPYLFGQIKDEMVARFKAVARLSFTAVLCVAVIMALTAPWVVPLLFGQVFTGSLLALFLLLPGILFSSSSKMLAPLLIQGGLQRFSLYAISLAAVLTIILDLALIPRFGIEGAAFTSTVAYLVTLLVILHSIRYRLRIPVHDLFFLHRSDISQVLKLSTTPPDPSLGIRSMARPQQSARVLCVVGWWPSGSDVAGIFIKEHVKAIAAHRPVEVLYMEVLKGSLPWPVWSISTELEDGLTVHRVRIQTPLRRFKASEFLVRATYAHFMKKWHRQEPFSLVHVHVRTEVTMEVLPIAARLDLPVVLTEQNSYYHLGIRALSPSIQQRERRSIRRWLAHPVIKEVMPVSQDLASVLRDEFGIPAEKIHVVPNIASDVFRPGAAPSGPDYRIALVAVWRPPKDHDVFIRALQLLPAGLLDRCRVDWIGYGPDYSRIIRRCKTELPEADIRFPGYMDKQEMAAMMRAADLFVLPTLADNLPCVVVESLCCGTPVLSMTVNGLPELIDRTNGLLVPPGDPAALATALAECISHPGLFDRVAIAKDAGPRYSSATVGGQIIAVYRAVESLN